MMRVVHPPLAGCNGRQECHPKCFYVVFADERPDHAENFRRLLAQERTVQLPTPKPCVRLGEATGRLVECPPCQAKGWKGKLKTFACAVHGECTTDKVTGTVASCVGCREWSTVQHVSEKLALGHTADGRGSEGFNASLLRFQSKLLLAYRVGWVGSELHLAELSENLQVVASAKLPISIPDSFGLEDPRLFVHNGRLHLSFVNVLGKQGPTEVWYMDLEAETLFRPLYRNHMTWEKNWQMFEWAGRLFTVYSMQPWRVLSVHEKDAFPFSLHDTEFPWAGGMMRGGASPVRVGDEYYCWFHGVTYPVGRPKQYNIGVVTFTAKPPFKPTRITPQPVMLPRPEHKDVVFPCGAVLEGGTWLVSYGAKDQWTEVARYNHLDLQKVMVNL